MRGQAVPGVEGERVFLGFAGAGFPADLRWHRQARNRDIGALFFVPHDRGVLDRHLFQIGAQLHAQFPHAVLFDQSRAHDFAQGVGPVRGVDRIASQFGQVGRDRRQRQFRDEVAITERHLREIRVAQRVRVGCAAQCLDRRAFDPDRFQHAFDHLQCRGNGFLHAFHLVGGLRERLQRGQECLGVGRNERRAVDHEEILRGVALGPGQTLAGNAQHFHRQPTWPADAVVQHVAGYGRGAQDHVIRPGRRKQALRQGCGQTAQHFEPALEYRMALGMEAAHCRSVILGRLFLDAVDLLVQTAGRGGFVRFELFDAGGKMDRGMQGLLGHGFSFVESARQDEAQRSMSKELTRERRAWGRAASKFIVRPRARSARARLSTRASSNARRDTITESTGSSRDNTRPGSRRAGRTA